MNNKHKSSANNEAVLDRRFLHMVELLNLYLNHFPNHEKHGLALKIRNVAYEMYELIVESQKRYHKKTTLTNLDIKHEQLRMLIRLAFELGYFDFKGRGSEKSEATGRKRYLAISDKVDEIGRIIGGWIKSQKT